MKQLKLKEIYELAERGEPLKEANGVVFGEYSDDFNSPPEGLESIGFVVELDDTGTGVLPELIDVIISFGLENIPILLEIPAQLLRKMSVEDFVILGDNLELSLSILPPGHHLVSEDVTLEEYSQYLKQATESLLNYPDFSVDVQPVSNYITYLMLEVILKDKLQDVFKVKNEYVIENFISVLPEKSSDYFKAIIKDVVYDHYGGKEGFTNVANVLINQVCDLSKTKFKEAVIDYVEKNQHSQENVEGECQENKCDGKEN